MLVRTPPVDPSAMWRKRDAPQPRTAGNPTNVYMRSRQAQDAP